MRNKLECIFVDLLRSNCIIGNLLFVQGVVEPKVDVPLPESFLRYWWHVLDCTKEDRSGTIDVDVGLFFKSTVVEP